MLPLLLFGSAASSLITASEVIRPDFPDNVANMIRNRFYVDDGSGGADTVGDAKLLKTQLIEAMALGGFELGKWKSNFEELLDGEKQEEEWTRVLGVGCWV